MEKEIFIKKMIEDEFDSEMPERDHDDRPPRRRPHDDRPPHNIPREDRPPHDRPRRDHEFEPRHSKIVKVDLGGPHGFTKTKLFTDKEEMVLYVNELGELGHRIDVYKIEESLYKVVVQEKTRPRPKFRPEKQ